MCTPGITNIKKKKKLPKVINNVGTVAIGLYETTIVSRYRVLPWVTESDMLLASGVSLPGPTGPSRGNTVFWDTGRFSSAVSRDTR